MFKYFLYFILVIYVLSDLRSCTGISLGCLLDGMERCQRCCFVVLELCCHSMTLFRWQWFLVSNDDEEFRLRSFDIWNTKMLCTAFRQLLVLDFCCRPCDSFLKKHQPLYFEVWLVVSDCLFDTDVIMQ